MPKAKVKYPKEYRARESFAVLIKKQRVSRSYSRQRMKAELSDPEIYQDFLKLCIEDDDSETLVEFRAGLLMVIKAIGLTWAAQATGISRMTLYRMLSKTGNPELRNLVKVLQFVGMRAWVVSEDFIYSGDKPTRYSKERPIGVYVSPGKRIKPKRPSD